MSVCYPEVLHISLTARKWSLTIPILLCLGAPLLVCSQTPAAVSDAGPDSLARANAVPVPLPLSNDRILGIIPNFQTVNDPTKPYVPLRVRDKWLLFVKETVDPYTFASAAAGAGIAQWKNDDPKYGDGFRPYMQRFGAATDRLDGEPALKQIGFEDLPVGIDIVDDKNPRFFGKLIAGRRFALGSHIGFG